MIQTIIKNKNKRCVFGHTVYLFSGSSKRAFRLYVRRYKMKGKISVCTIENLAELQRISIETFTDTFASENVPVDLQEYLSEAYGLEKLRNEILNFESRFFFIYLSEELAGYLKLNIGTAQTEMSDRNGLEVELIYIRNEFKRHGLGRQLLEYGFELANKEKRENIWLGVWERNTSALQFYRTFGFEKVGTHSFIVGNDRSKPVLKNG